MVGHLCKMNPKHVFCVFGKKTQFLPKTCGWAPVQDESKTKILLFWPKPFIFFRFFTNLGKYRVPFPNKMFIFDWFITFLEAPGILIMI